MKAFFSYLFCICFLAGYIFASPIFADDGVISGETDAPPGPMYIVTTDTPPETPVYNILSPQMDFRSFTWSYFGGHFEKGAHTIDISGGTSTMFEPYDMGDSLQTGLFNTTITYRYHGLFGGIIRPVARFSTGANQSYMSTGGYGFGGYSPGVTTYAVTEAGVEIVIEGVGIGVTAAKVWQMDSNFYMQDDKYTGGLYTPTLQGREAFEDWFTNIYLILE